MLRGTIITPEGLRPSTWDILDYTGELPFAPMNKSVHEVSSVKNSDASMLLRNGWTAAVINACAPWYVSPYFILQLCQCYAGFFCLVTWFFVTILRMYTAVPTRITFGGLWISMLTNYDQG